MGLLHHQRCSKPYLVFRVPAGTGEKISESILLKGYEGYIHIDDYSGYNRIPGVKRCLCYIHLRQAFVDALPKNVHIPETSKPAEAIFRMDKLFDIETELESLS